MERFPPALAADRHLSGFRRYSGACPPAMTLQEATASVGLFPGDGDRDRPFWSIISWITTA